MSAEDRIMDEAHKRLRAKLNEDEAKWLCSRLALATAEYPQLVSKVLSFAFKFEFGALIEEVQALRTENGYLRAELKKINVRLSNAGKLVGEIDKRTKHLNGVKK